MKTNIIALGIVLAIVWGIAVVLGWPEAMRWYAVVGFVWAVMWYAIVARLLRVIVRRAFNSEIELNWKPPTHWYFYRWRGFVHINNDGKDMSIRSYSLTVIFWASLVSGILLGLGFFGREVVNWLTVLL